MHTGVVTPWSKKRHGRSPPPSPSDYDADSDSDAESVLVWYGFLLELVTGAVGKDSSDELLVFESSES